MAAGLPPGGSYQPAPPLPDPTPPLQSPVPSDLASPHLMDSALSQKNLPTPPIIVDREKLNLPASVSSMEFIIQVIGDPHKFFPSDIIQTSHEIKEIDQAQGKDHYQAKIERKIRCKSADGKEQEFILQEKINIGIKVPDPRMSDERTMTCAKMEALFAVDGYESRITRAIYDRKVSDVFKTTFKVQLNRASQSEGFYGNRSVRSTHVGYKAGIISAAKHAFTPQGSVKGSTIDGMTFTSQIFVPTNPYNPRGELTTIKRGKWEAFKKIPCPIEKKRVQTLLSFTKPISDFMKGSPRWKASLAANETETKLLFDELKTQLFPKEGMHLSDVMSTTTRSLSEQIDALDDSILIDHTRIPPTTDEAITMLSTFSKELSQTKDAITRIQKDIDALNQIKNRAPEQENQLQSQIQELASMSEQLDELSEQIEDLKELLIKRVQLHSYKMKIIQEKLDTLELLTTHCSDMVEPKNFRLHKENLQRLHKQVETAELDKRLKNLRKIILKNTTLTETALSSPIPPRPAKPKAVPSAPPTRPAIPKKPLPPIPGTVVAPGKHAPPQKPLPPLPKAVSAAALPAEEGAASKAAASAKDSLKDSEESIPNPPAIDTAAFPIMGPDG